LAGRIADNQSIRQNIFGDNRSRSYQCEFPYRMPADNRRIRSYRSPALHQGLFKFMFPGDKTPWIGYIRKDTTGSQKDIIFTNDTGIDGNIVLYLYPVT